MIKYTENWYALCLTIVSKMSVSKALRHMGFVLSEKEMKAEYDAIKLRGKN